MDITLFIKAALGLGFLGAVFATGLAYASKKFAVEEDPKKAEIVEVLPGVNCGACGAASCESFAGAIATEERTDIDGCPVGGQEVADQIAQIMGVTAACGSDECFGADVLCQGGKKETYSLANYQGIPSCQAAELSTNFKSCSFGCLGFGDCKESCEFDAIEMNENDLPEIDFDKCAECGACLEECPRDLITYVSNHAYVVNRCTSPEKGKAVKEACEIGCIGCSICAKKCPVDAIEMEDELPVVDTETCIGCNLCVKECPTGSFTQTPFETVDS